jgi:phage tape measure protein|nr:MAG TPA: tail length tape measure protein [Caudoviricetes sp.]
MADSDIHIKIAIDGNSKDVRLVREEVNKLGNAVNNVDTYANALKSTIGKMAAVGLGLNGIAAAVTKSISAVDNLLNATGRLKLVTSSMQELEDVSKRLLNIANETRVGFAGVVDIHARLAMSLERLHPSQEKMLEATKAINKSLIISGSSAQSAEAALIQLGQGLASDALRGQELMSVMEQTPRLAKAIAEGMGISIGQLRKVAEEGKLTAQTVFDAILSQKDKLAEEFAQMPKTFSQSIVVLGNNIQSILGKLNEDLGFTKTIGQISESLSNALASLTPRIKEISSGIRLLIEALVAYKLGAKLSSIQTAELAAGMGRLPAVALLSSNALSAKTKALGLLSMGISGAKTALIALKNAFKTFLPAAVIFGAVEAFFALRDSMKEAKVSGDELNKILNLTNEELKKLTKNQLAFKDIELKDALDDKFKELDKFQKKLEEHNKFKDFSFFRLDDRELAKTKSEIDRIKDEIKQITNKRKEISKVNFDIEGTEAQIQKDNAQLDRLNKRLDELKGITTLDDLKEKAAALQKEIGGYQSKIPDTIEAQVKQERLVKKLKIQLDQTREKIANFNKKELKDLSNLNSAYLEVARVGMSEYDKKRSEIEEKYKRWLERGVDVKSAKKAREILYGELDEEIAKKKREEDKKALEEQESTYQKYYENLGKLEEAWQIERKKFQKQYVEIEKKFGKEAAEAYLKSQKEKYLEPYVKHTKAAFKDIKNSWADTVSSMSKTVDDGFFNFFIGKTKSLKTALKDIGTNLMRDMISPYARVLSQGISGGFGALLGGGSNLASIASNLGLAKNDSGGWVGSVGGTTVELSSTGQILRGANALDKSTTSLLSSVSNLQSAYSLLTSGYTGFISSFTSTPALNAASWLSMHGYAGLGQGVYGFGTGVKGALTATQFSGAGTAPYMAGSAFGGAALGYGIGYLGDKLFKANTYASTGGALGGAAGGLLAGMKAGSSMGPWGAVIGAVAGALIGGAFGKKKATGSGISVLQDIMAGDALSNQNIRSYVDMQKKGWFSKKSWTEMSDLDDASMREIGAQLRSMERMASRAGALASLTLKTGKYSGESLANEGFAKAILRSMTGQSEQMWAEVTESGGKKRKGLLGKIGGVFEKAMKFSPSSIINRITKPLDDAVSKAMNKAGLGAIDNMARGMRDEFGKASDGNIFGLKSSRKIDDLLNLSKDETNKNQRLVDNPEFSRMWKDWEEQAKKANKKVIELMSESLGAIADSYKSLELLSVRNPIKQVEISMRQAFESFTDAAEALKLDIPKQMGSIADLSVERMAQAYRKAIAADFTKSNVDSLNGLVKAYEAAKKAQDEYTKALIGFTQSIAQTQAGFYAAVGRDTNVLTLQNIYTKFRALAGSIEGDLGADEMSRVSKLGNTNDPRVWAEYFYRMSARELQEFLSTGNVEMRKQLLEAVTEYNNHRNQNGGHDVWLKSLTGLEEIVKQIKALDLAEQARKTLEVQKQQLAVLNLQKSAVEKLASMASKIRENVIDNQTAGINYALALQKAKAAFRAGEYDSKAYDELNSAVAKQEQNLRDNAATYQDYRYEMLRLANEVEGIGGDVNLGDLLEQIKKLDKLLNSANDTYSQQLDALKKQKEALELDSQNQIHALHDLLGKDSPVVAYLQAVRDAIIAGKAAPEYKGAPPANIANGATTANGALISSSLDKDINQIYMDVLGRSVEQGGLDAWKRKAQLEGLSKEQLRAQIEATARAATGGNSKQDYIEWSKKRGYKPFAEGGIVTRPTRALIGEAGYDEAVIPLDGRGIKVDMGGAFEALAKRLERVEQIAANIGRDVREMTMNARQTIDNGAVNVRSIA